MFEVGEFGTDLKSSFDFKDGDLNLVSDKENLIQSLKNRLNSEEDTYDSFYSNYGGYIYSFLGWKANNTTLKFLEKEIRIILAQEPKISDYEVKLEYDNSNRVKINLTVQYSDDSDLSLSFVIDETGEVVEDEDSEE